LVVTHGSIARGEAVSLEPYAVFIGELKK